MSVTFTLPVRQVPEVLKEYRQLQHHPHLHYVVPADDKGDDDEESVAKPMATKKAK